jgi:DNA ligase (NAD+)
MDELMGASQEELEEIGGLGPHTAESVVDFFSHERNQRLIEKLRRAGVRLTRLAEEEAREEGRLTGQTFVITGTLPTKSQEVAAEYIEAQGGRVTSSVSRNTSYLLSGERPGGAKVERAKELGVPIIGEDDLRRLVDDG